MDVCLGPLLTLEAKVGKQRNILGAFFALCELGKHQEAPPAMSTAHPDAFPADGQIVEVALGNVAAFHDAKGAHPFKDEIEDRGDDAGGKNVLGDVDADGRLDIGGPSVKNEQVDGGKSVDGVEGDGQDERKPQITICRRSSASFGPKVGQGLAREYES